MTIWDELIIADYESKWLDPDYDWENHRYRTYTDEPDEEETEIPVFETEEEENDWQEAQLLFSCEKIRKMVKCNA